MNKNSIGRLQLWIANVTFIVFGTTGLLGVVWPYIQQTFDLKIDSLGLLLGVTGFGRLVASLSGGWMVTRLGVHRCVLVGSLLTVVGLLVYALAPVWGMLLFAAFAFGVGVGALNISLNAFVAAHYNTRDMNWLHGWFGVGATIAPQIVTLVVLVLGFSWRWVFGVLFVQQVVITLLFVFTLDRWHYEPAAEQQKQARGARIRSRDSLKLVVVWFGIGLFFLHAGLQLGAGQLTTALFIDARGIDPKVAATWISVFWAGTTTGRFLVGFIVTKLGRTQTLRLNMVGTVIGTLLLWWNPSPAVSFLGLALIGLTLGPIIPTLTSATPERVGAAHSANTIGWQFAASSIGSAILPGIATALAGRYGLETLGPFILVLSVVTIILHEIQVAWETRVPALSPTLESTGKS
jgi:fucose permease